MDLTGGGHSLNPERVLRLAAAMGSPVRRLLVVGCEPGPPGEVEEVAAGLTEPVRAAVGEAVRVVESLVEELLAACPGGALPLWRPSHVGREIDGGGGVYGHTPEDWRVRTVPAR